ncbi:LytTR family DNA-binding domain-containing protein [Roseateles sp.]|uniref:LytR/AlgR family response regulator transcription factor n=1 Tax=Roseateles sp. TaxID=1971397 RepID=UPI003266D6DE
MKTPTALLIEDEPLPRQRLREGLAELWPQLQLLAEAEDGERGLALALELRPDIVFVDIRLPGLDGLQLARRIKGLCHIVFVTAYDAHALTAFDQGAVDYLLKPLATERLRETVQRLQQRLQLPPAELARWLQQWAPPELPPAPVAAAPLRWLQASQGDRLHLVMVADVSHFRSDNKYTCAVTPEGEFLLRLSLRELLAQLDPDQFWQIHRAVVINLAQVARVERSLTGMEVLLKDNRTRLPVSQSFQPRFKPM